MQIGTRLASSSMAPSLAKAATDRDIIFGAATGYSRDELLPFVTSIDRHAPRARIILLRTSRDEALNFDTLSVRLETRLVHVPSIKYTDANAGLRTKIERQLGTRIGCMMNWRIDRVIPINCSRFIDLGKYLFRNLDNVDRVIMMDTADAVLQSDPFPFIGDRIMVAEEGWQAREEPSNRAWTSALPIKAAVRDRLLSAQIICCGVVAGTASNMMDFCFRLRYLIRWAGLRIGPKVIEQPLVNLLARERFKERFDVLPTGNSVIAHCGPKWLTTYRWDESRGLVDMAGNLASIVHLYNRKLVAVDGYTRLLGVNCKPHQFAK